MKYIRVIVILLLMTAIAASCGVKKTTPAGTEPQTSAPTASAPTSTPETPEPVRRDRYNGTLYELREAYDDYVMPTLEDYVLGGFVEYAAGSEEELIFSLCGKDYEMHLFDYVLLVNSDGVELRRYSSYGTGGRFTFMMRSTAVFDGNGLLVSATLTDSLLPEVFTEEDIRSTARAIVGELTDFDPDAMKSTFCTVNRMDNGEEARLDLFVPPNSEEDAYRFSYEISYFVEVGGLKGGRYIDVRFNPYNRPLESVSISIGYDDLSSYKDTVGPIDRTALFYSIRESLDGILDRGNATDLYIRDDTLRFSIVNGHPCATVGAVVTIDYQYQYETTLCFFFDNDAAELKNRG